MEAVFIFRALAAMLVVVIQVTRQEADGLRVCIESAIMPPLVI